MKLSVKKAWNFIKAKCIQAKERIVLKYRLWDKYRDLAPADNISNGKEYLNALHWAIKNKRIKNIALTGPYGSGKSSIINTYLKRHPLIKAKHLRISMATFVENGTAANAKATKIPIEPELIQEGILKQLFYKVDHRRIPQSRYRKLYKVSFGTVWVILILLVTVTGIFSFIFAPKQYDQVVGLIIDAGAKFELTAKTTLRIFSGIVLLVTIVVSVIWRQMYSKLRINEVRVKNTTITPDKKDNESIFNKNMDEIVYFFEETKYRVVFFEDLDRLDSSQIFVQLRELNTLLNNSNTIKRPIVFVYAVKDDIFTEEDRTKFFEFIIPVIPVINSTNSGEMMLELFKANGSELLKHDITHEYILDVSPYISDMRVLQNIHNEFLLYKRTLRTGQRLELSDKMMLSLIIFKNLYPKDFADLQMEGGIVKQAFTDKQNYIGKKQTELQSDIDAYTDVIANVNADTITSTKELKITMLSALVNWNGVLTTVGRSYYGPDYTAQKILEDSFDWTKLCSGDNWYANYRSWDGSGSTRIQINNFAEICSQYYQRYQYLHTYEEKQLSTLQKDIEQKKQTKSELSSWSLQKLIDNEGDEAVFSSSVKENKLLVFMLRKGYIDEKYVSYVNYFKGSSITTEDMNYILSIKDHEAKPFDYTITKTAQVVQRLLPHEFFQREALNFTVLEYLLSLTEDDDKLYAMILQLSDGSEFSWRFIDEFVMQTNHLPRFIRLITANWDQMWKHIYRNPILTYNRKAYYLSLICANTGSDTVIKLNGKGKWISIFFEEHEDILQQLASVEPEILVSLIPKLGISFSKLKIENVDSDVLDCIFDNSIYAINSHMIHNVVAYKNDALCSRLQKQNYTTIIELGFTPLIEYVHENLPFYIDNIVLTGVNRNENINQIIDLIKRSISDVKRCERIIQFEDFCLSNISLCCGDQYSKHKDELELVWNALLSHCKVEPTWENVDRYWSHFGLTTALTEFVVLNVDVLANKSSKCLDDALRQEIIQSDIKPPIFTKLLKHLQLDNFDIALEDILEVNVEAMIKEHYLTFSVEIYKELGNCYPHLCETFILANKDAFLATVSTVPLEEKTFENLVVSKQTDVTFKESILKHHGVNLMSKTVAEHICLLNPSIPKDVFNAAWDILDLSKKKVLMLNHLDVLKAEDFEECFSTLGTPYQELTDRSRRHNAMIPDSMEHRKLAKRLQQVDYITSYDDTGCIKEYDFALSKVVEQRAILCRVKANASAKPAKK